MSIIDLSRIATASTDDARDEDRRRMAVVVWLFAAMATVPMVALIWWAL